MRGGDEAAAACEVPPPRRVLVVDDSRLQRRILAASLTAWGYDVIEAAGGAEALAICRAAPPDMILSDWMMPGMDGLAFCQAFRALGLEDYGYFILLTSKNGKFHVAEGLDAGADDFLTKPVDKGELRARMTAGERILAMQRQLSEKNRIIRQTLDRLQAAHDLIDSDLIEAKKLQQSLVRERFHEVGPARVSLLLRPAGRVGGDLVGFYPAGEGGFGCYAIDVSGHGISSALMTARLAGYLSAAAPGQNVALSPLPGGGWRARPPAEVAAELNRLVLDELRTEHYFTMILAHVLPPRSPGGVLHVDLVQAGHPHPVLERADGRRSAVGQGGMPVGLLPEATYDAVSLDLAPGDRLLIPSDGITECPGPDGGMLDTDGLVALMARLQASRGPALLEQLVWALGDHAGIEDFPDDISAVLIEAAPHARAAPDHRGLRRGPR